MPLTIRTIVADLHANRASSVRGCGNVEAGGYEKQAVVSRNSHIEQRSSAVKVTVDGGNAAWFRVDKTGPGTGRNGHQLGFQADLTTIATLTRERNICISPGYSGCLFSVYERNGEYKCCHTSRALGDGDVYVNELRQFAQNHNWNLVHEVPTRTDNLNGVQNGSNISGCVATIIVCRISYTINPIRVRTVRLRMNNQYISIHRARWVTPQGGATAQD